VRSCHQPCWVAGLVLLLLGGCSRITVGVDYDPSWDFGALRTYDWLPDPEPTSRDPRTDNTLLAGRVHRAVDRALAAKGYEKQTDGEPDFLVAYHTLVEEKTDVRTIGTYGFSRWGGFADTYVYQYEQGTLLIDIIDPKENALLWRGIAVAVIDRYDGTPESREQKINEAVAKIIDRFPPR
jgi:hypothetical protein